MRILVSNDDGYFAPGIAALAEALGTLGQVTVVAPERDRSGASNSLTLDRPLSLRRTSNGFYHVNGTPTWARLTKSDNTWVCDFGIPTDMTFLGSIATGVDVTLGSCVFTEGQ